MLLLADRTTRVRDVARPLGSRALALAGEPLTAVLRRAPLRLGVITEANVARALETRPPSRPAADGTHDSTRGEGPADR